MSHEIYSLSAIGAISPDEVACNLSFIGLYNKALQAFDINRTPAAFVSKKDSALFVDSFQLVDARKFIVQAAKNTQILIFNEAHYNPRNRVFVESLLQDLKKEGYKYFAAETFGYSINQEPVPNFNSGYYTREPAFANLVRSAVSLEYTLYPYEVRTAIDGKEREIVQAQNLRNLLSADSGAKIIVYCGYAHAYKDELTNWGRAMAGRLKEFTGINPFCIDQIVLTERSIQNESLNYYRIITNKYHPETYAAFVKKNGQPFRNSHVDMLVYYPETKYIGNRPGWLFGENKTAQYLKPEQVKMTFPVLIKAYNKGDDIEKMIPIDIIEIPNLEALAKTAVLTTTGKPALLIIGNVQGNRQVIEVGQNNP